MNVGVTLERLEDAMHSHLDSPVRGDFMSLTREWRGILESSFHGEPA